MSKGKETYFYFFKPTKGKVILTACIAVLYFVLTLFCSPTYVDTFDPNNPGAGNIYACGKFIADIVTLPAISKAFFILYLLIIYILASCIVYISSKKSNKK